MRAAKTYRADQIDAGKLRILGFETGYIHNGQILSIILIAEQREVSFDQAEAQDALSRSVPESPLEQATELLALVLAMGTLTILIPLFTGWSA